MPEPNVIQAWPKYMKTIINQQHEKRMVDGCPLLRLLPHSGDVHETVICTGRQLLARKDGVECKDDEAGPLDVDDSPRIAVRSCRRARQDEMFPQEPWHS